MKRRNILKPRKQWRDDGTWSQYLHRLLGPKMIRAAKQRLDREQLLWRWPAVVRVKAEYDRRRRARRRKSA